MKLDKIIYRTGLALLSALIVSSAFLFQWRPLMGGDEGRYTAVALQILDSRDITNLELADGLPHFTKPPLTQFLIAHSLRIFGRKEWAARLPNSLAWLGTIALLAAAARTAKQERPWTAGLVYAAMLMPFAGVSVITTDTLLAFWQALAVVFYMRARFTVSPEREAPSMLIMWLSFAAAFMTKGPVSLLPFASIVVFEAATRGLKGILWIFVRASAPLSLILALAWYLSAASSKPGLLDYWIETETFGRITGARKSHASSFINVFKLYLPVLVFGALPWTDLIACRLASLLKKVRRPLPEKLTAWCREKPFDFFILLWFFIPVMLLSVFPARQPLYLLPSFAPLAVIISRHACRLITARRIVLLLAVLSLYLTARHTTPWLLRDSNAKILAEQIQAASPGLQQAVVINAHGLWLGVRWYLNIPVASAVTDSGLIKSSFSGPQSHLETLAPGLGPGSVLIMKNTDFGAVSEILSRAGLECRLTGSLGKTSYASIEYKDPALFSAHSLQASSLTIPDDQIPSCGHEQKF